MAMAPMPTTAMMSSALPTSLPEMPASTHMRNTVPTMMMQVPKSGSRMSRRIGTPSAMAMRTTKPWPSMACSP